MIDLAIAYRVYPGVSKTPAAWSDDKFKLFAYCLSSFKQSLGSLRVKIWVLLDGCPPSYEAFFRESFSDEELVILNLDRIGNHATFAMQLDLLSQQTEANLVYFAEDDYIYAPDALVAMVEFARANPDADFVTAYDHSGNYDLPLKGERHRIRPFGGRHWRTSTATCLTFLATRASLLRTRRTFATYAKRNEDGSLWMSITQKLGLFNLPVYGSTLFMFKLWLKAWYWGWNQIFFGGFHRLWSPVPSLATHLESTCLAPAIDWNREFRRVEQEFVNRHKPISVANEHVPL
jgi:hypothetical protein